MKKLKITLIILILILELQLAIPRLFNWTVADTSWDVSKAGDGSVMAQLSDDGVLTISGSGEMRNWYTNSTTDWHSDENRENVYQVIISEGITNIGDYAFYDCTILNQISIPTTVTSIEKATFYDIPALAQINVNTGNQVFTSEDGILFNKDKTKIIRYPSRNMNTNYSIPDTVNILDNYSFERATMLTDIILPNNLTNIGEYAFSYCTGIKNMNIPSSVKRIESSAFDNCLNMESISLQEGLTYLGNYTFYNCLKLTNITIPNTIEDISPRLFSNCINLSNIVLSTNTKTIGEYAFENCNAIITLTIPSNVTTIGNYVFNYCNKLTTINIPESVTDIGKGAFYSCSSLNTVTLSTNLKAIEETTFFSCTSLQNISIPSKVELIGNQAFYNCNKITEINIPASVTQIEQKAFELCSELSNITVDINSQSFIDEEGILYSKDKKRIIKYPSKKQGNNYKMPYGLEIIDSCAFEECTNLTDIIVPNTVTIIGSQVFKDCTNLTNIIIPNSVLTIGNESLKNTSASLKIKCKGQSTAEQYAINNEIQYEVDNDEPIIQFSQNGNVTLVKKAFTSVNVSDNNFGVEEESLKYKWSEFDSGELSENLTEKFNNGDTLELSEGTGTFYLWIYAEDLVGNITMLRTDGFVMDNTGPHASVTYNKQYANVNVIITVDEPINAVEGWALSDDKLKLTKQYSENTEETVIVSDLIGNETSVKISVTQIEKIPPILSVKYSTIEPTNQDVVVAIISNEPVQPIAGWTLSEDKLNLIRSYSSNVAENITVLDLSDNQSTIKIEITNIDKTAPTANVTYSTISLTNQDVIVTIISNKELQNLDGWTLLENNQGLTKAYSNNVIETVAIKDKLGNENNVEININNIDKTGPIASVNYLKNGETVMATINSNKQIEYVTGWDLSEDCYSLTKSYDKNQTETVTIKDFAGNTTNVKVVITGLEESLILNGDLNGNGVIDINDILKMQRHIAATNSTIIFNKYPNWKLSDELITLGDLNKNGVIDVNDILKMQRYIAASNSTETANKHPDWLVL